MRLRARTVAAWGAVALGISNLGRLPAGALGGREAPLILADLVTVTMWLFLIAAVASGRVRVTIDRTIAAVIAFVAVATVSTGLALLRYDPGIVESAGMLAFLVRWVAYFGWYPFVAWCLTRGEADDAWRNVERALLAFCIFGILQSAFLPGFAQMIESANSARAWDVQGRRLVSTVLDPNFAGIFIVIALLARLARVTEGAHESGWKLAILATGLLLTVSRSSILAMLVGLTVLGFTRGLRLRLIRIFVAAGLLLLPFITVLIGFAAGFNKFGVDGSAAQRLIPWSRAILLIRDHPLLGVGFNAIPQAQQVRGWRPVGGAESTYDGGLLFVAAMTGLLGLLFYTRILARVWGSARRTWRDAGVPLGDRAHASAAAASIAAVCVHSLFVNSLLLPFVMQILWTMWARLAHAAATHRGRLGAAVAAPVLLLVTACDPCAGTAQCTRPGDAVTVGGAIVHYATGEPVSGARVDVRFTSTGEPEVVQSVVTDAEGLWEARATVAGMDSVWAHVDITPDGGRTYAVPPFPLDRGEPEYVGQWVDVPYVQFIAFLTFKGAPLTGADVEFRPSSGVMPTDPEVPTARTDGIGAFTMLVSGPAVGAVVGDLVVEHAVHGGSATLPAFPIQLGHRYEFPVPRATVETAPRLAYGGAIVFLGTGEQVGGVDFEFRRTGGIQISPSTFTVTSRPDGYFNFAVTPLASGDVIGDVTIRPPTGPAKSYAGVRFATYTGPSIPFSGLWGYGEAWKWTLEIVRHATGGAAAGVPVTFRRTGGLDVTPQVFTGQTDAAGRFQLHGAVRDTGVVVGELIIAPPGEPEEVIRDIRLRTNPDNAFHFAGVFGFGPPVGP